jgi:hypothetical protein
MIYEKDWIMRQIKVLVRSIAQLVFHRDLVEYEMEDETHLTTTDFLHRDLLELIHQGRLCEAEDTLFDHYLPGDLSHLRLALDFYQRLNLLSDDELEAHSFSRDEIYDGLRDIMHQSGMEFYGL